MDRFETAQESLSAFPFFSRYCFVDGLKMHYVREGQGPITVLLHDIPLSSYLWRNVIAALRDDATCIAIDLIGMGKSERSDKPYRLTEHVIAIAAFIEKLELDDVTLVMHGWGSVVGLQVAQCLPDRITALVMSEPYLSPLLDAPEEALLFAEMQRTIYADVRDETAVVQHNFLIEHVLPQSLLRKLNDTEMAAYRAPFEKRESRRALWEIYQTLPLLSDNENTKAIIAANTDFLLTCERPKLLLFAMPGLLVPVSLVQWCQDNLQALSVAYAGEGLHYPQEDDPQVYAATLKQWINSAGQQQQASGT